MFFSLSGFKWFGSLTNLRRKSDSQKDGKEVSEDDMGIHPRTPSYANSSEMYTHMGTMPRHPKKEKSLKKSKSKEKNVLSRSQSVKPVQDHVVESPLLSVLSGKGLEVLNKPIMEGKPAVETKDAHIQTRNLPSPPTLDGLSKEQVISHKEQIECILPDSPPETSGDGPPDLGLTKESNIQPVLPMKRHKENISMKNTVENFSLKIDSQVEETTGEDFNIGSGNKEDNQNAKDPNR